MLRLMYISIATQEMSTTQLTALLEEARTRNQEHQITGMLLYKNRRFIQLLEGPRDAVEKIYRDIREDDRNAGNIVIEKSEIENRLFSDWKMGFENLDHYDMSEIEGYTDFLNQSVPLEEVASDVDQFVSLFYHFKYRHDQS